MKEIKMHLDVGGYYTIPRIHHCGSERIMVRGIIGEEVLFECARCKEVEVAKITTLFSTSNHKQVVTPKCKCDIVQLWNTGIHNEGCESDD